MHACTRCTQPPVLIYLLRDATPAEEIPAIADKEKLGPVARPASDSFLSFLFFSVTRLMDRYIVLMIYKAPYGIAILPLCFRGTTYAPRIYLGWNAVGTRGKHTWTRQLRHIIFGSVRCKVTCATNGFFCCLNSRMCK